MSLVDLTDAKKVHFNWPQRRGALIRARIECFVGSRGIGKTFGFDAERLSWNAFRMPRSLGGLVVPTFKKFFTQFIPSLYTGLQIFGYEEGRDYFIKKEGPANWKRPYNRIIDWGYALHWRNGSALAFIGQDRVGSGNGLSLDYLVGTEAKLLNAPRLQEDTLPAIRGNKQHFGAFSEHGSQCYTTDRPTSRKGQWIYKYRDQTDPELLKRMWEVHLRKLQLETDIRSGRLAEATVADYMSTIRKCDSTLNELRKYAVYYHEGNILDNIDMVGLDAIMSMDAGMDDAKFRSSVLNEEVFRVDGPFYGEFDEDEHCYMSGITPFTEAFGYTTEARQLDCRDDAEIMPDLPLEIAMDYGGKFNCMVVGQQFADLLRIDHGFHAIQPQLTVDCVDMFIQHFRFHKNKRVFYYYDSTALQSHGATQFTYHPLVCNRLRAAGWEVIDVLIGVPPAPRLRHVMWMQLLREKPYRVMINRDNCEDLIKAIQLTAQREGRTGVEKDKNDERGPAADQVHAPHYTDALDTLVWGKLQTMGTRVQLPTTTLFL